MRKIVCIGILLFSWGCVLSAQNPYLNKKAQTESNQQEKVIITKRPLSDEEKSAFRTQKQECTQLLGNVFRNRSYSTTLELVKLRMELEKLSPPSDIKANIRELQEIADALRMTSRLSPMSRAMVTAPKDCMAFPRCPTCQGTGKVLNQNGFGQRMGNYTPCREAYCNGGVIKKQRTYNSRSLSGVEYEMVFDPVLGKEAFLLRLEKISAWLILVEIPEYVVERIKDSPEVVEKK